MEYINLFKGLSVDCFMDSDNKRNATYVLTKSSGGFSTRVEANTAGQQELLNYEKPCFMYKRAELGCGAGLFYVENYHDGPISGRAEHLLRITEKTGTESLERALHDVAIEHLEKVKASFSETNVTIRDETKHAEQSS